jgi:hypothetical protein
MKRSRLLASIALLHWLAAAVFFLGLLAAVWARSTAKGSVSVGPVTCSIFALTFLLIGLGVWKQRKWGQWTAITVLAFLAALIGYAAFEDGEWDRDLTGLLAFFWGLLTLHLLPWTWRAFRSAKLESPASTI